MHLRRIASAAAGLIATIGLTACGGSTGPHGAAATLSFSGSQTPNAAGSTLQNADDLPIQNASEIAVGSRADLGSGVAITVQSMKVKDSVLQANVRLENAADTDQSGPDLGIACTGQPYDADQYQADSTLTLPQEIPASAYKDGMYALLIPGDHRTGEPIPACTSPAYVLVGDEDEPKYRYPIPSDLVTQLNSEREYAAPSSATASSTPVIVVTPTSTSPTAAVAHGGTFTYGAKAKDLAAALACTGVKPLSDSDVDLGVKPTEDVHCTAAGKTVELTTWKNAAQENAGFAVSKSFIEGFGIEVYLAKGDGWFASLDSDDSDPPLSEQKTFASYAAKALGGKVVRVGGK